MTFIKNLDPPQRIALGIEYNGHNTCGWQYQPNGKALQNHLEKALEVIAQEKIKTYAAGRTDAGVHAIEQVVHFDTLTKRPLSAWVHGVNNYLPSHIAIKWAKIVPSYFHARFSAISRHYSYWLFCHPTRPALLHGKVGWCFQNLNILAMEKGAQWLVGEHDFSSFRSSECQATSAIKILYKVEIVRKNNFIFFELEANAFLHHMVRNIVGALIYLGKGAIHDSDLKQLLIQKNRNYAPPTFMPDGLYLSKITYPKEFKLPKITTQKSAFAL